MVQTARKHIDELPRHFGHLVVDECHRTPSTTFQDVVSGFDSKYMLGLSATAYRRDGLTRLIYLALGDRVHRVDPGLLQTNGAVLAPAITTRETAFQYEYNEDYQAMISELIADYARNQLIARDIRHNTKSTTALVVSDRVEHLNTIAGMVDLPGMEILTGSTSAGERQRIVEHVHKGKVRVLFATIQLIGEGFDCDGLADLYLTTPIRYEGRLVQVAGRILRPADGKRPRIFDYVDAQQPVLNAQAIARTRVLKNLACV
jgi:superfamily II DNA or RNA helicase